MKTPWCKVTSSPNHGLAQCYAHLVEEARRDPQIVALWLDGSRGKAVQVTPHSDYDVRMIVADEVLDAYRARYEGSGQIGLDLSVMTMAEFERYAEYGTAEYWDRYNFTHLTAIVDKTNGHVQQLIDAKGRLPAEQQSQIIAESLDAFINQVYRVAKCERDGDAVAAHLEAANAIPSFLTAIFALHGRVKPYYKYLVWELAAHPLDKLPWKADVLVSHLLHIVTRGDADLLLDVLRVIRPIFRVEGFGPVFDGWRGYYAVGEGEESSPHVCP